MPGIVGIIAGPDAHGAKYDDDLSKMVQSIRHEPFYTSGTFIPKGMGVWLGWAAFEGESSRNARISSGSGRTQLIFSGEHFGNEKSTNDAETAGIGRPSKFKRIADSYEISGTQCLINLNGWFSGVLVDLDRGTTTLFNDRYGINRVYYYEGKDAFYFASEAKALLEILPELREIDYKGMGGTFHADVCSRIAAFFSILTYYPVERLGRSIDTKK